MHLEEPIDIFLSHDRPLGISGNWNWQQLVRYKKHFKDEIQQGTLGSKPAAQLLEKPKPSYWFSAHLHCKFTTLVEHEEGGRKFLQIVDIGSDPGPYEVQYDGEWLAITRKLKCLSSDLPTWRLRYYYSTRTSEPTTAILICRRTQLDMQDCRQWDRKAKPCEFSQTAPPHKPSDSVSNATFSVSPHNPQTVSFLELLDLPYVLDNALDSRDTPVSLPQKGKEFSIYLVPLSFDDITASDCIFLGIARSYVLDNASDSRDTPASLLKKGKEFSIYLVPLSFDDVTASGM
ncbi:hypothetical protein GOBAR_DD28152 [Gossypium barbadense]|nr:hypothetical protein GOBAR_DD28152 [Gossypium barbadense]